MLNYRVHLENAIRILNEYSHVERINLKCHQASEQRADEYFNLKSIYANGFRETHTHTQSGRYSQSARAKLANDICIIPMRFDV